MAIKKNKTDLFRFVTLRGPQLVDDNRKLLGFIFPNDPNNSHFLSQITANSSIEDARLAIAGAVNSFTPLASIHAVKNIDLTLWEFSNKLLKNKNKIDELTLTFPSMPSSSVITQFWDNVFYDILERKNRSVRQASLQMIVAVNYIQKMNDSSLTADASIDEKITTPRKPEGLELIEKHKLFKRRVANAKIVLHPAFTLEKIETTEAANLNQNKNFTHQQGIHQSIVAKHHAEIMKTTIAEIKQLELKYKIDKQKDYDSNYTKYLPKYENAVANYLNDPKNNDVKTLISDNKLNLEFDGSDYVPDDIYPPFVHKFDPPFSSKYGAKLSTELTGFVQEKKLENASTNEAIFISEQILKDLKKMDYKFQTKRPGIALINGVKVKTQPLELFDFSISFDSYFDKSFGNTNAVYLSIIYDKKGAFATSANYSIVVDGGNPINGTTIATIAHKGNAVLFKIFDNVDLNITPESQFSFQGSVNFHDGRTLTLPAIQGLILNGTTSGSAITQLASGPEVIHYGINKIGVADFRKVEQELCCYVPGEVSHIENIMAKEYKEKSSRSLTRSQLVTDFTKSTENESLNDTTSTSRFEMSSEIADMINRDRSLGLHLGIQYKGEKISGDFSADFATARSTSHSNSSARTTAKDITNRALDRIVQKISLRRTSTMIREYEENIRHGFDNTGDNASHVSGVYRWVDKEYTNRLINYGKRLIYEFMLPEPARFYKRAVIIEAETETNSTPIGGSTGNITGVNLMPVHPKDLEDDLALNSLTDVDRDNYSTIAAIYGADVTPPLAHTIKPSINMSETITNHIRKNHSYSKDFIIPDGYYARVVVANGDVNHKKHGTITFSAGGSSTNKEWSNKQSDQYYAELWGETSNQISIAIDVKKVFSFSLSFTITCYQTVEAYQQWQIDTYDAIMTAYNQKMQEFTAAEAVAQTEFDNQIKENEDTSFETNPKFNQQTVLTEIKRLCIEMLMRPFGLKQGRNFYKEGACNVPVLPNEKSLRNYAEQVKFFEQAYQWELFAAKFYPYYWAARCDWKDLFQSTDSLDHIFQAFLQSGMAKVQIPVRPGFEDAVIYYMETGEVWTGNGMVFDTDDDLYLSLVDEMNDVEGWVEKEWKSIVPTSLTLLQAESALLSDTGLPCCGDQVDIDTLGIITNPAVLKPKADNVTP